MLQYTARWPPIVRLRRVADRSLFVADWSSWKNVTQRDSFFSKHSKPKTHWEMKIKGVFASLLVTATLPCVFFAQAQVDYVDPTIGGQAFMLTSPVFDLITIKL